MLMMLFAHFFGQLEAWNDLVATIAGERVSLRVNDGDIREQLFDVQPPPISFGGPLFLGGAISYTKDSFFKSGISYLVTFFVTSVKDALYSRVFVCDFDVTALTCLDYGDIWYILCGKCFHLMSFVGLLLLTFQLFS